MTDEQRANFERVEQELRLSERRYTELFENANDIVFTTDLDLVFTSVNAAGEALTGYDRREACGLKLDDVLAPSDRDRFAALVAGQLAGDAASVVEVEVRTRDGRSVPLEVSVRVIRRDGRAEGIQAIARDVSERKALEAQLRQAQKMEAVGRLAGGVAHDFNNLLTVILGYGESLAALPDLDAEALDDIEEICRAARRAADLTRQLLAFSRRQLLAPEIIDINQVVGEMTDMIARLVGEDVEVRVVLAPQLGKTKADPGQIAQILMNLVVNARDAMPTGGRLTVETADVLLDAEYAAAHQGARPGPYVRLAVSDSGVGMDPATQARIFEPFFTTKGEGKGTGLGLSTVYGIVKQSGGYISVRSEPGAGATFEVYLPRCGDEAPADEPPAPRPHRPGSGKILLVEDDDGVRDYVRRVLVSSGFTVLAAASPAQALRKTAPADDSIDLLVTDVVMPGINGRTLARMLAPDHPGMKVLYMSGYTSEAIVSQGVLDPSVEFLPKPFTAAELRAKVRNVLGLCDDVA